MNAAARSTLPMTRKRRITLTWCVAPIRGDYLGLGRGCGHHWLLSDLGAAACRAVLRTPELCRTARLPGSPPAPRRLTRETWRTPVDPLVDNRMTIAFWCSPQDRI